MLKLEVIEINGKKFAKITFRNDSMHLHPETAKEFLSRLNELFEEYRYPVHN